MSTCILPPLTIKSLVSSVDSELHIRSSVSHQYIVLLGLCSFTLDLIHLPHSLSYCTSLYCVYNMLPVITSAHYTVLLPGIEMALTRRTSWYSGSGRPSLPSRTRRGHSSWGLSRDGLDCRPESARYLNVSRSSNGEGSVTILVMCHVKYSRLSMSGWYKHSYSPF